jgi:hypothetical protein
VVASVTQLQEVLERGGFVGPVAVMAGEEAVLAIDRAGDYAAGFLLAVLADGQWSMDAVIYDRTDGAWRDGGSSGVVIGGEPTPWVPPSGGWGHGPLMGCAFTRQLRFESDEDDEYWVSADVGFLAPDADHLLCVVEGRKRRIAIVNPLRAYAAVGRSATGDFHLIAVGSDGSVVGEWSAPEP